LNEAAIAKESSRRKREALSEGAAQVRSVRELRPRCRRGHTGALLKGVERAHESKPPPISADSEPRVSLEQVAETIGGKLYPAAELGKGWGAIFSMKDAKGCDHAWISPRCRSRCRLENAADEEVKTGLQMRFVRPRLAEGIARGRGQATLDLDERSTG